MTEPSKPHMDQPTIAILGAGFSGLGMAAELQRRGIGNFTIYEKADDVGGTWRENSYPGVACDVPSHLYSFSFDQNPNWSERFSRGGEIQSYIKQSTQRLGLYPKIQFGREVESASHNGEQWQVMFKDGQRIRVDVLISGLGGLHIPNTPEIKGHEEFEGPSFHSARWDHEVALAGKRVAIIGSAASAVQIAPEIAPLVSQIDIYQRTANWVVERGNYRYSGVVKSLLSGVPALQRLYRGFIFNLLDLRFPAFIGDDNWMRRQVERNFHKHLARHIKDPDLRAKLTPDYPPGCKRILVSDDFYPALAQDHVNLITDPIMEIDKHGIRTKQGTLNEADIIIYATGFKPFNLRDSLSITNVDGLTLAEHWKEGIAAHKTVAVPGFPDCYMLLGPNSGLGHNSVVLMIEAQTRYIGSLIDHMINHKLSHLHPDRWSARQYDDTIQKKLSSRVWAGGCQSWYLDETGRNFTLYPGSVRAYRKDLRAPDLREYDYRKC